MDTHVERDVKRIVTALLTRPEGASYEEIRSALNWSALSVARVARQAGLRLRTEKIDGLNRYYGSRPTIVIRERSEIEQQISVQTELKLEEPEAKTKDEGRLSYQATSEHLHVVGPLVAELAKGGIVPITIEHLPDAQMNGSAFDVIIKPNQIRIIFNEDHMISDRNKGLVRKYQYRLNKRRKAK